MPDPASMGTRTPVPPLPFPNSYWVIPGKLLAGEHPGGGSREETKKRLQQLLGAGVTCFIDLTMPDELPPYDMDLPMSVEYIRKPIKDHAVPARREHMLDIQASLDYALRSGQTSYVHCRAGIGRTGTVIACFLIECGLSPTDALEDLNRMWQQSARAAAWPHVPETDDQTKFVLNWTAQVETLLHSRVAAKSSAAGAQQPSVQQPSVQGASPSSGKPATDAPRRGTQPPPRTRRCGVECPRRKLRLLARAQRAAAGAGARSVTRHGNAHRRT